MELDGKQSTESLREAFNKIDKDNSGTIEAREVFDLSKELGLEVSREELSAIFQEIDTNKDARISFDEFLIWWSTGRKSSKMAGLVTLQLKLLSYLNTTEQSLNSVKASMGEVFEKNIAKNSLEILSMDSENPEKMGFEFEIKASKDPLGELDAYKKSFGLIEEGPINIWKVKTSNPEAFAEKIQETIEIFRHLSGLGEEFDQNIGVKVKVEDGFLMVCAKMQGGPGRVFDMSLRRVLGFLAEAKEEAQVNISGGVYLKNDLRTLIEKNLKPYQLITDGFRVNVSSEMNSNVSKTLRKMVLQQFEFAAIQGRHFPRHIKDFVVPFLLMRNFSAKINADSSQVNKIIEDLLGSAYKTLPGVVPLIDEFAENFKKKRSSLESSVPIVSEWVKLLQSENISEIQIKFLQSNFSSSFCLKGEGIQELMQKILK
jgi:hypothetical protein